MAFFSHCAMQIMNNIVKEHEGLQGLYIKTIMIPLKCVAIPLVMGCEKCNNPIFPVDTYSIFSSSFLTTTFVWSQYDSRCIPVSLGQQCVKASSMEGGSSKVRMDLEGTSCAGCTGLQQQQQLFFLHTK